MAVELKSLSLRGFKSYRELESFTPGRMSVLIGGNGVGKSNLISFFSLLYRILATPGELQIAVELADGASRLLHDGPKKTESIRARLELQTDNGMNFYEFRLMWAANDKLIFADESWGFQKPGYPKPQEQGHESGHREASIIDQANLGTNQTAHIIRSLLRKCVAYQFHDTSSASGMRLKSLLGDGRYLKTDGSNLAAFLFRLSQAEFEERLALKRIQDTIRLVLPFFAEFVFEPENGAILLKWRERGADMIFTASQASDGMLRLIALIALLCQPKETLPAVLMLDEPELGLHPQAITLVARLMRQVSGDCQVIAATQSVPMVDEFSLNEIVVLSRAGRETTLRRLSEQEYSKWLDDYSAGELWRKNVLEGGPGR